MARRTRHLQDAQVGVSNPHWGVWSLSSPTCRTARRLRLREHQLRGQHRSRSPTRTRSLPRWSTTVSPTRCRAVPSRSRSTRHRGSESSASVGPTTVHPNGQVTYRVTVTNKGTGIAPMVDVLVTLPPVLQYQSTIMPFGGNTSEESLISPVKGAYLVFYGGFEIPPQTSLGPGTLTIEFIAQCIPDAGEGRVRHSGLCHRCVPRPCQPRQCGAAQRVQLVASSRSREGLGPRARGNLAYRAR